MVDEVATAVNTTLHWGDIVVICAYFVFVIGVGIWTSTRNRGSVKGYFLAGQNQHWIPVGASIFASNIGSQHFLGLAGGGAATGLSVAYYELHAVIIVMILGWVFVPVYLASGTNTMPEYLRLRFGGRRIRVFLSAFSLLAYIFTKISIDIYAGTVFVEQAIKGINMFVAIAGIVTIAALFTITGGLTAVIWTDFVQTIIMVAGAILLCILSFIQIGGYSELVYTYHGGIPPSLILSNSSCNMPLDDAFHIFRDPLSPDLPWPGALTGAILKSFWYWCADQVIVQRALAAKNITHAKAGTVLAAVLKLLPLFLLVMPGMIARILYPETVGCADAESCTRVCGSTVGCSNIAYSALVLNLMPAGIRGLMLAVMLAALMSSLTSVFNSSSTIFTLDIWILFRKKATSHELMVVGRVFVIILVGLSVFWVPMLKGGHGSEIFTYTVQVGSFFQPPIIAAFTLALFTSRVNEKGAFWSMVVGGVIGVIRFALEYSYEKPTCEDGIDTRPSFIKDIHFLYYAVIVYVLCLIIAVVISLLTKPIHPKHLHRLTFWNRFDKDEREDLPAGDTQAEQSSLVEEEKSEDEPEEDDDPSVPWYKLIFLWICGIDHRVANDRLNRNQDKALANHQLLKEKPIHKAIVNIFAVLTASVLMFVMVFYK